MPIDSRVYVFEFIGVTQFVCTSRYCSVMVKFRHLSWLSCFEIFEFLEHSAMRDNQNLLKLERELQSVYNLGMNLKSVTKLTRRRHTVVMKCHLCRP